MMKHNIHVDLMPQCFRGKGAINVDEEHLPFEWDDEKLFCKISKPTKEELESLEILKLNSLLHDMAFESGTCQRKKKQRSPTDISMKEWRKRFAMLPEAVMENTLENSTNFYLNVEAETREDPKRHYKYCFPALQQYPRQKEVVATDTFFTSAKLQRGNTCLHFVWE
eukprot:974709-Ditylum_brightwellii.AAC.1